MEGSLRPYQPPAAPALHAVSSIVLPAVLMVFALVTPLVATAGTAAVTLTWTAPGDDGRTGVATQYDLRQFTIPINQSNFPLAIRITGVPVPAPAGTAQTFTITGLNYGTTYYFALKTADERGNWSGISNIAIRTPSQPTGVEGEVALRFSAPFPNPSRGRASFSLGIPKECDVSIEAYDVTGRLVRTLARGSHPAGASTLVWDLRSDEGRPLATGMYLVRARIGEQTFTRRVIVQH